MKKIELFYVYAAILFIMAASYIALFIYLPINAMYENGYAATGLASGFVLIFIFALLIALFLPFAVYDKLYSKHKPPADSGELLSWIVAGVVFMVAAHFFGAYPQLNQELTTHGYENVLKMTSQSEATQSHYERLEKNGVLTVEDLDSLLDTFEIFEDEVYLKRKLAREKELASKKEEAKQALLQSKYGRPAVANDTNSTMKEY